MISPSIGRIVWLYLRGKTQLQAKEQPHAAIVAYVHSDTLINVAYFDSNGLHQRAAGVRLLQEGEEAPGTPFCAWMPYQQEKAKAGDHNSESAEPRPQPGTPVPAPKKV
jgi:hypothetical protein